jgi:Na+-driven multidrug efflux pump
MLGLAVIRLPLAVLLAWPTTELPGGWGEIHGCGLGAVGAWYAMAADLVVRGLAMLVIFSRLRWSRVRV